MNISYKIPIFSFSILILLFLNSGCTNESEKELNLRLYDEMLALDRSHKIKENELYKSENLKLAKYLIKTDELNVIYNKLDRIAFEDKLDTNSSSIDWSGNSSWPGLFYLAANVKYLSNKYPEFKELHDKYETTQRQLIKELKEDDSFVSKTFSGINKKHKLKFKKIDDEYFKLRIELEDIAIKQTKK